MSADSFRNLILVASLAGVGLAACTKPPTEEEMLVTQMMEEHELMPATAEEKAEIAKQDMITQATFWGREYDRNPSDHESALHYARALRAIGSSQKASEVAAQALAMHPADKDLSVVLAKSAVDQGRPDAATTILFQALAVTDKTDVSLISLYGVTLDYIGEHEQAQDQYRKALALEPDNAKVMTNLALSHALQGDAETAETLLRSAVDSDEKPDPRVRQNLAMVLGLQGKFDEARELTAEDLPPIMVSSNLEYYRSLLTPKRDWGALRGATTEN